MVLDKEMYWARIYSPYYIDDLSAKLNKTKAGCYIGNSLLNEILFADDVCCFSPYLDGLQLLVDAWSAFAARNDLELWKIFRHLNWRLIQIKLMLLHLLNIFCGISFFIQN